MDAQQLDSYDTEHLRDALIQDPRVNELDLHLKQVGDELVATGNVGSQARRDAITAVLAELAPGVAVRNDVTVTDLSEPDGEEVVT